MKKISLTFAAALALAATLAHAQTGASAPAAAASAPAAAARHEARVEERITYLHNQLKITPEQESQWKTFADTMRDNGATMARLYRERMENKTASALDDMKQYAELTQANADGAKARRRVRAAVRELPGRAEGAGRLDVPQMAASGAGQGARASTRARRTASPPRAPAARSNACECVTRGRGRVCRLPSADGNDRSRPFFTPCARHAHRVGERIRCAPRDERIGDARLRMIADPRPPLNRLSVAPAALSCLAAP